MNRGGRHSRDPRRGLPSLAERQRTNFALQSPLPNARPRFHLGQNVRMALGALQRGRLIPCEIVKLLPFEDHIFSIA